MLEKINKVFMKFRLVILILCLVFIILYAALWVQWFALYILLAYPINKAFKIFDFIEIEEKEGSKIAFIIAFLYTLLWPYFLIKKKVKGPTV